MRTGTALLPSAVMRPDTAAASPVTPNMEAASIFVSVSVLGEFSRLMSSGTETSCPNTGKARAAARATRSDPPLMIRSNSSSARGSFRTARASIAPTTTLESRSPSVRSKAFAALPSASSPNAYAASYRTDASRSSSPLSRTCSALSLRMLPKAPIAFLRTLGSPSRAARIRLARAYGSSECPRTKVISRRRSRVQSSDGSMSEGSA